jgi:hypothetical protein
MFLITVATTTALAQPAEETYSPKDGKFSVRFPGKPKEQSQSVKTELGNLRVMTVVHASADGKTNWVSHTDYPADAVKPENRSKLVDGARDGMKGMDGKVVTEKDIECGTKKLPGREVLFDRGKFSVRCRFVIRDQRLYQVAVLGPGEYVTGKEATLFLDSFEVK